MKRQMEIKRWAMPTLRSYDAMLLAAKPVKIFPLAEHEGAGGIGIAGAAIPFGAFFSCLTFWAKTTLDKIFSCIQGTTNARIQPGNAC